MAYLVLRPAPPKHLKACVSFYDMTHTIILHHFTVNDLNVHASKASNASLTILATLLNNKRNKVRRMFFKFCQTCGLGSTSLQTLVILQKIDGLSLLFCFHNLCLFTTHLFFLHSQIIIVSCLPKKAPTCSLVAPELFIQFYSQNGEEPMLY